MHRQAPAPDDGHRDPEAGDHLLPRADGQEAHNYVRALGSTRVHESPLARMRNHRMICPTPTTAVPASSRRSDPHGEHPLASVRARRGGRRTDDHRHGCLGRIPLQMARLEKFTGRLSEAKPTQEGKDVVGARLLRFTKNSIRQNVAHVYIPVVLGIPSRAWDRAKRELTVSSVEIRPVSRRAIQIAAYCQRRATADPLPPRR